MDREQKQDLNEYEEPILLGADDLEDVTGGCLFACSDGSCRPKKQKIENAQ